MNKFCVMLAAFMAAGFVAVAAAADLKSGLQPGDFPPAFIVKDVTGPSMGEELCYRCKFQSRPVVSIFAHEVDENLAQLLKDIDKQVADNADKQMRAFFVLLTDNPKDAEARLAELAQKNDIKNIPLTIYEGSEGPKNYKLSADADVTVLMWVQSDVKVSHAFAKGKLDKDSIAKVVGDSNKILN